jgi:tetratricopeptide (TPR) repeat protein
MREAEAEALRLNQQVMQLAMQGKLAEAIPLARRALELTERVHGKVHPNVSADLITLADLYRCQGDFFNAEPLIARAIEVDKQLYGPRDAEIGVDMGSLAMLYASKGDAKAAVKTYGEALDILYAARPSARHMANMAEMHRGYAEALLELNRYEEAMKQYANAEQIYEMTNNPARAAKTLVEMAEIDRQHGNQRRANIWLDRARQLKGQ